MGQLRKLEFFNFAGGANTEDADHEILPIQSPAMLNIDVSKRGKWTTRAGFDNLNTTIITSATGIYGATYALSKHIACALTSVYSLTTGTYGAIKTGLTNNTHSYFAELQNGSGTAYLMGVNGTDAAWKWDGATATAITTPPSNWAANPPSFVAAHEGKMFAYTASTNLLAWSDDGTLDVWTTADNGGKEASAFNPKHGTGSGIVSQRGGLVVFKTNEIYKVTGISSLSFSFPCLYPNIGCVAPRTIVNINNKVFFLGQEGNDYKVYVLDDSGGLHWMSGQITTSLNDITVASSSLASAGHYQGKYVLSFPTSAGWVTWRLNYSDGSWEPNSGNSMACYYNDSNGLLFGGSLTDGYTHTMDTGTNDNGVAITCYATSRGEPLDSVEYIKIGKELWLFCKASGNYKLYVTFYIDGILQPGTHEVYLGTQNSKRGIIIEGIPLPSDIQGHILKVRITGSSTIDQPIEVYKAFLYYEVIPPQSK